MKIRTRPHAGGDKRATWRTFLLCLFLAWTGSVGTVHAASAYPEVVSIVIGPKGTYWNGGKVDSVQLQHRCLHASQTANTPHIVLTIDTAAPAQALDRVVHALAQADMVDPSIFYYTLPPDNPAGLIPAASRVAPKYPPEAIRNRLQGNVMLAVHIDAHGQVLGVLPKARGIAPVLVQSALEAVVQWQFDPAVAEKDANGEGWVDVPVDYELHVTHQVLPEPTP